MVQAFAHCLVVMLFAFALPRQIDTRSSVQFRETDSCGLRETDCRSDC